MMYSSIFYDRVLILRRKLRNESHSLLLLLHGLLDLDFDDGTLDLSHD